MTAHRTTFTVALLLVSAVPSRAQSAAADTAQPTFTLERSIGFSWISTGGSAGRVTNRRVYVTALRWTSVDVGRGPVALRYAFDVMPLVVVERTAPNRIVCFEEGRQTICHRDASARVAVGTGGSPIGAKLILNRGGRARVQLGGNFGAMVFSSDVPIHNSRRFNFTYGYGVGLETDMKSGRALSFGYKFLHVSNAGTGQYNPGLDANVIYVGLARGSRHP